jgi:hypothetical protein
VVTVAHRQKLARLEAIAVARQVRRLPLAANLPSFSAGSYPRLRGAKDQVFGLKSQVSGLVDGYVFIRVLGYGVFPRFPACAGSRAACQTKSGIAAIYLARTQYVLEEGRAIS